jgi:hypothetical protein
MSQVGRQNKIHLSFSLAAQAAARLIALSQRSISFSHLRLRRMRLCNCRCKCAINNNYRRPYARTANEDKMMHSPLQSALGVMHANEK